MIQQLSPSVWFGNWSSPVENNGLCQSIINVAHHFSHRRNRSSYWARLEQLDYRIYYTRLALKDREWLSPEQFQVIQATVLNARLLGKLPILCHCQMGGHRGPSTALLASVTLGEGSFDQLHARLLLMVPGLVRGRGYYRSMIQHLIHLGTKQ